MALFQKKLTFEELLKAAAALSDEEKEKLREALKAEPAEAQADTDTEKAPEAAETQAETEPAETEAEPHTPETPEQTEDSGEAQEHAEEDGGEPHEEPAAEEPEAPQGAAESVEEETEEARDETTQDAEADDHTAEMVKTLSDRVCALEETLKELSALKERMEEYDKRNAERFGYAGKPGKGRRSYDDMSAAELKAEILGR